MFWRDWTAALRSLRRTPVVSTATIVAVAVGIGTVTLTYSAVDAALVRSFPFPRADRLVEMRVHSAKWRESGGATSSWLVYRAVASHAHDLQRIAAYTTQRPVLTDDGAPERITSVISTPGLFDVLGVVPQLGRTFRPDDATPGTEPVALLSNALWRRRFGGDSAVIARELHLDGRPVEIVGVLAPHRAFPGGTDIWVAGAGTLPGDAEATNPEGRYRIVGRLADGVSLARATAELRATRLPLTRRGAGSPGWHVNVAPLRDAVIGPVRKPMLLLLGAVCFVLLVACANVATVLLARGVARRREFAVRAALGASPRQLLTHLLTEPLLLGGAGGACGVALAYLGEPLLARIRNGQLPASAPSPSIDGRVLLAALAAVAFTVLAFAFASAVGALRRVKSLPRDALHPGARATPSGRRWATDGLVAAQLAVTLLLLAGAALLVTSVLRIERVALGFEPAHVLTASLHLPRTSYGSAERVVAFSDALLERSRAVPGVRAAALSTGVPLSPGALGSFTTPGTMTHTAALATITGITPGFFRVLGISLLNGRSFQPQDARSRVVIVNRALAPQRFPGRSPIGHSITYYGGSVTARIVGVVGDTRDIALRDAPGPQIYEPFAGDPARDVKLTVLVAGHATRMIPLLRRAIHSVDPGLPAGRILPMRLRVADSISIERRYAAILASFAGLTLVMALVGLFGTVSYSVAQRSREFGVRLALGADPGRLVRSVL